MTAPVTPVTCLVCAHAGLDGYLDMLLKCPRCGFVTARVDAPLDAASLYVGDYFQGEEYFDYPSDEAFFKKNFRTRLRRVRQRQPGGRLLEIGAAYGFFLDLAQQYFEVVGYEVNPEAARYARAHFGLDVRTDDFLRATPADIGGPVDVIAMWDVIEHLARPDRFIAQIATLSRPGALLYITTGDIGSWLARARGRKWRMIHPPTHLHYFSRPTLTRLLAAHGFRVVEIHSVSTARSLRQILYSILVLRMGKRALFETVQKVVPPTWGFSLNTFDIMQAVAEKGDGG
jgi:SAM-dependent methyltransferase